MPKQKKSKKSKKPRYQNISIAHKHQIINDVNNLCKPIQQVAAELRLASSTIQ
ncbi:19556_t:CDS:1, partial [Racocetra persica]